MSTMNRQWLLRSKPTGEVSRDNFQWREVPVTEPAEGEILVRTVYISIDPVQRYWLSEKPTFGPPTVVGQVMPARIWGVVEKSKSANYAPGDWVAGLGGWQAYCTWPAAAAERIPRWPGVPLIAHTSLYCMQALAAYFGLLEIGQPKAGETVVVSAAAGGVGSLVVQIARIQGCRVVAIAGTRDKCDWLTRELGADAAINYNSPTFAQDLDRACPAGIDVYYDNVGGDILDAVLARINPHARIACGGFVSHYNDTGAAPGPVNFPMLALKQARAEGFSCFEYVHRAEEAFSALRRWHEEGKLTYRAHVFEGLDSAPEALAGIFHGRNTGKGLVQVSAP